MSSALFTFECWGKDTVVRRGTEAVAYITKDEPFLITFTGGHAFCEDALNKLWSDFKEWKAD